MGKVIEGFSKLSKSEKIDWITKTHFKDPKRAKKTLEQYWNNNSELQKCHDEIHIAIIKSCTFKADSEISSGILYSLRVASNQVLVRVLS